MAYLNPEFLNSPDGRLLRILSEYQEPLSRFRREKIQDTVVFFGSARFASLPDAQNALTILEKPGSAKPASPQQQPGAKDSDALQAALKRAHAGVEMARYYEEARRLAAMLTEWTLTLPGQTAQVCGDLRRRPRNYGSRESWRARSRRQDHWPEYPAAV